MRRWVMIGCVVAVCAPGVPAAQAATATDEMVACAALGAKRPGNDADRRMGDVLIDRFRRAGLETSAEEFRLPVWQPRSTSLRIADGPGAGRTFDAESFAYSASGRVRAPVVDLGSGQPSDYEGVDVRGKIVMVNNSGVYHRTIQVQEIMAHGGAAMLYVSTSPKNLIQTGAVRWGQRPPVTIPAITVGAGTGAELRARMREGAVTLALEVQGERVDAVTRNIVGVRKGATYPDRYIVVAGHYDSWHDGANDNCSAIGTLLSVVEANRAQQPAYTMVYIGWGAEEPGLVGSYTWIWRHQDLVRRTVLNINLEETATATFDNGEPTSTPSATLTIGSTSPPMVALTTAAAASNVVLPPVVVPMVAARSLSGGIIATDIEGFYAQGVQGVSTASTSPYYHTTGDTAETVNPADLERATTYIRDLTRHAQAVPPAGFELREVPRVTVSAPDTAAPGAAVPIEITVTAPTGEAMTGQRVLVLAGQQDNWAVAESHAEEVGGGRYRWTLPAGATDADLTRVRATISTQLFLANGFATIDQRAGGLLTRGSACRSRRVIDMHVSRVLRGDRRVTRLRATSSRGRVRVRRGARRYTVRLDLRQVRRGTVRVRLVATTTRGTLRQSRVFRTCRRG